MCALVHRIAAVHRSQSPCCLLHRTEDACLCVCVSYRIGWHINATCIGIILFLPFCMWQQPYYAASGKWMYTTIRGYSQTQPTTQPYVYTRRKITDQARWQQNQNIKISCNENKKWQFWLGKKNKKTNQHLKMMICTDMNIKYTPVFTAMAFTGVVLFSLRFLYKHAHNTHTKLHLRIVL